MPLIASSVTANPPGTSSAANFSETVYLTPLYSKSSDAAPAAAPPTVITIDEPLALSELTDIAELPAAFALKVIVPLLPLKSTSPALCEYPLTSQLTTDNTS